MPDPEIRPQPRPRAVTTGALLTWVAGGFITVLGGALLIATLTGKTALALALAGIVGLAGTSTASPHPAVGAVMIAVGVLPSLLALAAFHRARVALIGLAVAAGAYALLVIVLALDPDHGLTILMLSIFGGFWIAVSVGLFWSQQDWYGPRESDAPYAQEARDTEPVHAQVTSATDTLHAREATDRPVTSINRVSRPRNLLTGVAMVGFVGAVVLFLGCRLTWTGFTELLDPNTSAGLSDLAAGLGLVGAGVGVVILVLAGMTLTGSLEMLVALTVVGSIVLGVYLLVTTSVGDPAVTLTLDILGLAWMIGAGVLLWSRPSRQWCRSRGR